MQAHKHKSSTENITKTQRQLSAPSLLLSLAMALRWKKTRVHIYHVPVIYLVFILHISVTELHDSSVLRQTGAGHTTCEDRNFHTYTAAHTYWLQVFLKDDRGSHI